MNSMEMLYVRTFITTYSLHCCKMFAFIVASIQSIIFFRFSVPFVSVTVKKYINFNMRAQWIYTLTFWLLKCQWHYYDNVHTQACILNTRTKQKKCTKKNEAKMNGCFILSKHFFQAYRIYPSWILKYKWQLYQTWSAKKVLNVVMSSTHIRWNWIGWVGGRAGVWISNEKLSVQIHFIHINSIHIIYLKSFCCFVSSYIHTVFVYLKVCTQ